MDNFASVSEPVVVLKFFQSCWEQYKSALRVVRLVPSRCCWPDFKALLSALGALDDIAIPLAPTSDVTSRLCPFYLGSYSLDFPVSRVVSMCSHPSVVDIDNNVCRRLDSDGANGKKNRRCFPPQNLRPWLLSSCPRPDSDI